MVPRKCWDAAKRAMKAICAQYGIHAEFAEDFTQSLEADLRYLEAVEAEAMKSSALPAPAPGQVWLWNFAQPLDHGLPPNEVTLGERLKSGDGWCLEGGGCVFDWQMANGEVTYSRG